MRERHRRVDADGLSSLHSRTEHRELLEDSCGRGMAPPAFGGRP